MIQGRRQNTVTRVTAIFILHTLFGGNKKGTKHKQQGRIHPHNSHIRMHEEFSQQRSSHRNRITVHLLASSFRSTVREIHIYSDVQLLAEIYVVKL